MESITHPEAKEATVHTELDRIAMNARCARAEADEYFRIAGMAKNARQRDRSLSHWAEWDALADGFAAEATEIAFDEPTPCPACGQMVADEHCHSCRRDDIIAEAERKHEAREERASDLIDDGIGLRARGGLVYFS